MKNNLYIIVLMLCIGCKPAQQIDASKDQATNIILIIADDMNWDDCGAYGHPNIKTPNIDQLAADGMRFDHAYVTASSCSPSRASIITGRYPHNTGAEQLHWSIPLGSKTFVQQLKSSGYYTAAAGKWHMGPHVKDHFDLIKEANVSGFQLPTGTAKEAPKMIAKQPSGCEDWISTLQARPKDKSFFMWFAALDPHRAYEKDILPTPHRAQDVIVPPYLPDVPDVREDLRQYYDEISRLDAYVGKVVNELATQGVSDNTMIIFISDNGRPFPRDKTTLYDGGIKTPWIVKWPSQVKAGTITKSMVSTIDIAPTLSEIAGLPDNDKYEGTSFLPILNNPSKETRAYAYGEDHWHDYEDHGRAIFNQKWKLIRNDYFDLAATPSADAGRSLSFKAMQQLRAENELTDAQLATFKSPRSQYELFDLEADPNEINNLANDPTYAQTKKELLTALNKWSRQTDDFMPTHRTPDEFNRLTGEPDHTVRKRPRPDKKVMFGSYGKY